MFKAIANVLTGKHDATVEPVETAWDTLYRMAAQNRKAVLIGAVPSQATLTLETSVFYSDPDPYTGDTQEYDQEIAGFWRNSAFHEVTPEMVVCYL